MSYWISCNSCFLPPGAERHLAVTTCGHVICGVCYQKGNKGRCLICSSKCQVSPISDKSSSEVKALFSNIATVTQKHFEEVSKVLMFQARHQKRLLTHYQQRNEKLEEVLIKMKQEMQQMTKKLSEQSAYITKLENLHHHSATKAPLAPQMGSLTPQRHKSGISVLQIPFNSPVSLTGSHSMANVCENMEVDSLFRKPNLVPRLSLVDPQREGRSGSAPHPSSGQNLMANHSAHSSTVSRFPIVTMTPDISYRPRTWKSPIFNQPPSCTRSMSNLVFPPP